MTAPHHYCTFQVHDAYIELAELLVKTDPMAAVEVYCRFPLNPVHQQTFDDAFIVGEIVHILMKQELYDHPHLGPNLIAYGKLMGLGMATEQLTSKSIKSPRCIQTVA